MKVWRVYTGWVGYCNAHHIVLAQDAEEAIAKVKAHPHPKRYPPGRCHAEEVQLGPNGVELEPFDG